jgi:hypothetical protein
VETFLLQKENFQSLLPLILLQLPLKNYLRWILQDIHSGMLPVMKYPQQKIASVLGNAIGKPDLAWVQFTDEDALNGMIGAGLPEEIAKNYAEMNRAMHTGIMAEDYFKNRPVNLGKTKLQDFAKTFAAAYQG